jgi:hypothetical protein
VLLGVDCVYGGVSNLAPGSEFPRELLYSRLGTELVVLMGSLVYSVQVGEGVV